MAATPQEIRAISFDECRLPPFEHQKDGIRFLLAREAAALFDEMGVGKTKQTIDAAMFLYKMGYIDTVIIIAPAAVRSVWFHPELGELAKHLWDTQASEVTEYHRRLITWTYGVSSDKKPPLKWIVTNYDWVRLEDRFDDIAEYCGPKTMLVLDESSYVKSPKAKQSKACKKLRRKCGRVVLLNGTPIANSPGDMYSQGEIMDPSILDCRTQTGQSSYFVFRARYGVLGGFKGKQIMQWRNLEDMQQRFAPHVIRRLKEDCLDLPEKLPTVIMPVALTPATWRIYKEMRDDMLTWLDQQHMGVVLNAAVKGLRLAQITSGFLGGVQRSAEEQAEFERPAFIPLEEVKPPDEMEWPDAPFDVVSQEISSEKLDLFVSWLKDRLEEDPNFSVLVWSRFRAELARVVRAAEQLVQHVGQIHGGQKKPEREHALALLDPRVSPKGSIVVVGTPQTGRAGLNLTATSNVVYMSNDFSLFTRLQSEDRVHRPGQKFNVNYFDIVATGPQGQATIDTKTIQALRAKQDVAKWTTDAWRRALTEE